MPTGSHVLNLPSKTWALMAGLGLLVGCASVTAEPGESQPDASRHATPDLTAPNRQWLAHSLLGITSADLADGARPWVQVSESDGTADDHQFSLRGNAGCNSFSGLISWDNGELATQGLRTTRMYCPDSADIETAFLNAADRVAYHGFEGEYWVWYDADGETLAAFRPTVED